ncbi:MAG TPA: c-type cytochrome [Verrucomicrobia bacterium]|nr:c-type cytochrome [Verrucomicrobiota bacterium]
MPHAILSSVYNRADKLLEELLNDPGKIGSATLLLEPLCRSIAAQQDNRTLTWALGRIAAVEEPAVLLPCLRGFDEGLKGISSATISDADHEALYGLLSSKSPDVRQLTANMLNKFQELDPVRKKEMLSRAAQDAADLKLPVETRMGAVNQLAVAEDTVATAGLLAAWPVNTPTLREAIFDAIFKRRNRLPALLDALEKGLIPPVALTAFQRVTLLENDDQDISRRASKLFSRRVGPDDKTFQRFAAALTETRNMEHGKQVFQDNCATCHQMRGIGFVVGPDLGAEFQRAEEAILKDILAPNDVITAGYSTYLIETSEGQFFNGILSSESATSVTLHLPTGLEQIVLRKDIARISALAVSLMPEALVETLKPEDLADVIAWMRDVDEETQRNAGRVVLFDDEAEFISRLTDGGGRATMESEGAYTGESFLAITPPQRYSVRIPNWNYRVVENPGPGEFRYLRLAWRTMEGEGVLIELAADGSWPNAEDSRRRYFSGKNTTKWEAMEVSPTAPREWRVVTLDLWKDNGGFTLTGIAPTAMGGTAQFDRIELLQDLRILKGPY